MRAWLAPENARRTWRTASRRRSPCSRAMPIASRGTTLRSPRRSAPRSRAWRGRSTITFRRRASWRPARRPDYALRYAPRWMALFRALGRLHAERGLSLEQDVARDHAVRCAPQDLDEMLGNLLDNACTWGRRRIHVSSSVHDGLVTLTVDDDGEGLEPELMPACCSAVSERMNACRARVWAWRSCTIWPISTTDR